MKSLLLEAVIGLEVHVQLATQTKLFCSCGTSKGGMNTRTCPICSGHPGVLPVLNRTAVEYAIVAGLALNCRIQPRSVFSRKNYFYPDLPKGFQITQFDRPICTEGQLEISTPQGTKEVRIKQIHLEEDAGKSIHHPTHTEVDLNRAGVPLIEIVTEPDLRTPEEAGAYLRALHAVVVALGITEGNLEEGNFRCDVNVSVRPLGSAELSARTELKNLNSFRFVERALKFEIARQFETIRSGGQVNQETRSFDPAANVTVPMRSKEEAADYRYFPEPDLPPLRIESSWVEQIKRSLPELPAKKKERLVRDFGLSQYDAGILTNSIAQAEFFETALSLLQKKGFQPDVVAEPLAHWMNGEVLRLVNETGRDLQESLLAPEHVADLIEALEARVISGTAAKYLINIAWQTGEAVKTILERENLYQLADREHLAQLVEKVVSNYPSQVAEYRAGKVKLFAFFVGQLMRETGGKADSSVLRALLEEKLREAK